VFSYSPRQGTEAATMLRDDVPPQVKAERRRRLHEVEKEVAQRYHRSLIGRVLDVLVEGGDDRRPGSAHGTSCRYAPVSFPGHAPALVRRRVLVRVVGVEDGVLVGEPEPGALEVVARPRDAVGRKMALPLIDVRE